MMKQISSKAPTAARLLFGTIFFVFGLNGFLQFLPQPAAPEAAGAFLGALAATGYMFPLIKITEILAGLMLLTNRFVPLALIALAPIVVNIVAYHAALDPNMGMAIAMVVVHVYLGWSYRSSFRGVLAARAEVTRSEPELEPELAHQPAGA